MINTLREILIKKTPGKLRASYQLMRLNQQYGEFAYRFDTYYRQSADVFFVSFPKSGRTWVRYMISKYLEACFQNEIAPENLFAFSKLKTEIPTMSFTHDGSSNKPLNLNYNDLKSDKSFYFDSRRVVLLVRDPRDVVVSYFHHATARKKLFKGSISDFIRSENWGIRKNITFLNNWSSYLKNSNLLLIRYEDFKIDPENNLKKIIDFLNIIYNPEFANEAIEVSHFDKMKHSISKGQINSDILVPTSGDPNSAKVRKGEVAGYLKELNETDIKFVNDVINELSAVYGYK